MQNYKVILESSLVVSCKAVHVYMLLLLDSAIPLLFQGK